MKRRSDILAGISLERPDVTIPQFNPPQLMNVPPPPQEEEKSGMGQLGSLAGMLANKKLTGGKGGGMPGTSGKA